MKEEKEEKKYCPFCGKLCLSEREANRLINAAKRGYRRRDSGKMTKHVSKQIPKRKYWCSYCHSYHLSHLPYYKKDKYYE